MTDTEASDSDASSTFPAAPDGAEPPAESAVEQPAEPAVEQPAEPAVEQPTDEAAAPPAAPASISDAIADAAEMLFVEHGTLTRVDDRSIILTEPVKGDPSLVVMRVLGLVQHASPAGAAAAGNGVVAIGVWRRPELYVAAWTKGKRRVVGYRLGSDAKLTMYIRTEGRIPTRMEFGNWYGVLPDDVTEAFLEVGLLVDEPPFEIPVVAPTPAPPSRGAGGSGAGGRSSSGGLTSSGGAAPRASSSATRRARTPRAAPAPRPAPAPTSKVCPECGMRKALAQFVAGSELCIDCR